MTQPTPKQNRCGFTLIEVLLAVAVFAIVLAAINTVFFAALRLRNTTMNSIEAALPLNHALATIQKDLEGIMLPSNGFAGGFNTMPTNTEVVSIIGERVSPDIFTTSGAVNDLARWSDAQRVTYYLALPTNSAARGTPGRELVRMVTRNLLPVNYEEPERHALMDGIDDFRMQYFDGLNWIETWDSSVTTNLPTAVKVQIITVAEAERSRTAIPIELVVPILVQAMTNSAEEASTEGAQ